MCVCVDVELDIHINIHLILYKKIHKRKIRIERGEKNIVKREKKYFYYYIILCVCLGAELDVYTPLLLRPLF